MKRYRAARVFAPLLLAAGMAMPAVAAAQSLTFYACAKDNKVIPGTIQVGARPSCNGGATSVWWAQGSNVRVVGGAVASDGRVVAGKGFSVVKTAGTLGQYTVVFEPGKFKRGVPAQMTVTPLGLAPFVNNPVVMGATEMPDGSLEFQVWMSYTTPNVSLDDQAFMFVVVQN